MDKRLFTQSSSNFSYRRLSRQAEAELVATLPGIKQNVSVEEFTTFALPGRVKYLYMATSQAELLLALEVAEKLKLPYYLLGGGSNVVCRGRIWPGLLIVWRQKLRPDKNIFCRSTEIQADAGLKLFEVVKFSLNKSLAGLESLAGIPGTLGGAIVGNAGAYGSAISDHLTSVTIWRRGRILVWPAKRCRLAYRDSIFKQQAGVILRATFLLSPMIGDEPKRAKEIWHQRRHKYPIGLACPGSYFKNLPVARLKHRQLALLDQSKIIAGKVPAGYLLQAVGATGLRSGALKVADYHGNLLINEGGATYADVRRLTTRLKKMVKKRFDIDLEEEVRYIL